MKMRLAQPKADLTKLVMSTPEAMIDMHGIVKTFKTPAGEFSALKGIDLTIARGEFVSLVGKSGSGKSTLINLLLRFHEMETGSIRIDGQDIRELTQESLRRSIGVVAQDVSLLHRSIAENIAYGTPGATQAQIEEAARRAHAHLRE